MLKFCFDELHVFSVLVRASKSYKQSNYSRINWEPTKELNETGKEKILSMSCQGTRSHEIDNWDEDEGRVTQRVHVPNN